MKKILFIDTDMGGDCDDVGAIALANILKNENLIEIAGITHTTSLPWGPACIDIVNRYYGNPNILVGATKRKNYIPKKWQINFQIVIQTVKKLWIVLN